MNTENAYIIGLKAITFIMNDESLLSRFVAITGIDENDIRSHINDELFLSSSLDFLLNNENDLINFCNDSDIQPQTPMHATQILGGGSNWDSI